jgi:pimeloyl-ACP methyl ester carboxylesterase
MATCELFLRRHGFDTLNISYPSNRMEIDELGRFILAQMDAMQMDVERKVHFVGHSMGGLVIRSLLREWRPRQMGRVVVLGTPNGGSEVADLLHQFRLYRWFYGPSGQQLKTSVQEAFCSIQGAIDYEIGIVAGTRTLDPIGSIIIGQANDGRVSVESTRLPGMKDHLVLPVNHTFLPRNSQVLDATLRFLKTGTFAT